MRMNADGSDFETVAPLAPIYHAIHMDFHFDLGIAYYNRCAPAGCTLQELSLETGAATLITEIGGESYWPKVDSATGSIYYVEYLGNAGNPPWAIKRRNLDGSNETTLYTNNSGSIARLQLDRAGGKLYWVDGSVIRRMNTDGTGVENLVSAPGIRQLFVESVEGKLYWFQHTGEFSQYTQLHRANLDGSNVEPMSPVGAGGNNSLFVVPKPAAICTVTAKYADIVAPFAGETVQPDFTDVGTVVDCFRAGANCDPAIRALADLHPCYPFPDQCLGNGGLVDFADVSRSVDAFRGLGCP